MLGENSFTQEYINNCRERIHTQLATYDNLLAIVKSQAEDNDLAATVEAFETEFFNNMVLVLDWLFVHRLRKMEGKDGNPLNEVRVLSHSLSQNTGIMGADKQIKLKPEKSILGYEVGDEIKLSKADFIRLSGAFFTEIEKKFLAEAVTE